MSPVTKIFIVFHVILSLLLAAGLIVFVNRTDEFATSMTVVQNKLTAANNEAANAKSEVHRQSMDAAAARSALVTAQTDAQTKLAALNLTAGQKDSQIAELTAAGKSQQGSIDNLTFALGASEFAKKVQADTLDSTRVTNNELTVKNSQLNIAVGDLTNRWEVASRQVSQLNETVAQYKEVNERNESALISHGITVGKKEDSTGLGSPAINGIVRTTTLAGGIRYATISVGSQDQVKPGMKFSVIDRAKSKFLGELTVEKVDEHAATGRLEGPSIGDVHDDYPNQTPDEVKTQL